MGEFKYRIRTFIPAEVDNPEPLSLEEAQAEEEQLHFMHPENIQQIILIRPDGSEGILGQRGGLL